MNDNLISCDTLKKSLNFVYDCAYIDSKSKEGIVSDIIETIDNAPTVDLWEMRQEATENALKKAEVLYKRVHGKWITDSVGNITCSNCGFSLGSKVVKLLHPFDFPHCPDCGVKMDRGKLI